MPARAHVFLDPSGGGFEACRRSDFGEFALESKRRSCRRSGGAILSSGGGGQVAGQSRSLAPWIPGSVIDDLACRRRSGLMCRKRPGIVQGGDFQFFISTIRCGRSARMEPTFGLLSIRDFRLVRLNTGHRLPRRQKVASYRGKSRAEP